MKKCQNCERMLGEDAHERHTKCCQFSPLMNTRAVKSPEHVQHEANTQPVVISDGFIRWLTQEFVSDHQQVQIPHSNAASGEATKDPPRFESRVNPSPRILYESMRHKQPQTSNLIVPPRRPSSSGAWRKRESASKS